MRRASFLAFLIVASGCGGDSEGMQGSDVMAGPGFGPGAVPSGPGAGSGSSTSSTPGTTPASTTPPATAPSGPSSGVMGAEEDPAGEDTTPSVTPGTVPPGGDPGGEEPPGGTEPAAGGMGAPAAGMGGSEPPEQPMGGDGAPTGGGSAEPTVPEITAECPTWRSGTITFMGLSGITIEVGQKASGPTAPMVFYWHGTGSFAGEYAGMASAVHRGVMEEGGILVSFQGTTGGDLLSGTAIFGRGDFELADQLFACAVRDHNIDPRRVFATGCSAGGLFSGAMAAARSSYMAAAAPNSGGLTTPVPFDSDYTPALMTIHGAPGVDVVIIDFSQSSATADSAFKDRGGFVINCNHGGGHCGGGGLAPDIWEFFKAHPYGVDPHPWEGGLPSGFNSDCEIY